MVLFGWQFGIIFLAVTWNISAFIPARRGYGYVLINLWRYRNLAWIAHLPLGWRQKQPTRKRLEVGA